MLHAHQVVVKENLFGGKGKNFKDPCSKKCFWCFQCSCSIFLIMADIYK